MFLSIRKERKHHCGHSNIDFRTNNSESLSKFVNSKNKTDFILNAKDNYFDNSENTNYFKSSNKKKVFLKLPFNDQRKIKKISEAIENNNIINNSLEKTLDPKFTENRSFFKIISPLHIKFSQSQNFMNFNKNNRNEENKNSYYNEDVNIKVDSAIKDIRQSYSIENEFNRNDLTINSEKIKNNFKRSIDLNDNEFKSKYFF